MSDVQVTVTLPVDTAQRLAVLADDDSHGTASVARVLAVLADHVQQGVYRPGSWERPWLCQVFGDEWLSQLEPDTDDLSADGRVIFDRPRMPR
jgi:hypothetical protein